MRAVVRSVVRVLGRSTLQPLGEEVERLPGLRLLLAREVDAPLGSGRPSPRRRPGTPRRARTWSTARGSASRPGRATSRRPAGGRSPSGANFSLSTKIGPSTARSSSPMPFGRVLGVERPLLLREQLAHRPRAAPSTSRTLVACRASPSSTPEQTKPPGIASTSTPKAGDRAHARRVARPARPAAASRPSRRPSPGRAERAPRAPASFSVRSGVSKKNTCRIWASSGSIPSATTAERVIGLRHRQLQLDACRRP